MINVLLYCGRNKVYGEKGEMLKEFIELLKQEVKKQTVTALGYKWEG